MKEKIKKIDWFEFINIYLNIVYFEKNNLKQQFQDFFKKTNINHSTESLFEEFIIFNLFIDYAIFLLHFSKEKAHLLYETLEENMVAKLIMMDYKIDNSLFMKKVEERFTEYLKCLKEFTPRGIKRWNINKHFGSELGKKFAKNFIGEEKNPLVIYPATFLFLTKVKVFNSFLEEIKVIF